MLYVSGPRRSCVYCFVVLEGEEFWVLSETMRMLLQRNFWVVVLWIIGVVVIGAKLYTVDGLPHRILLDTDVDTDDFFALLYLLKQNRSQFDVEVSQFIIKFLAF